MSISSPAPQPQATRPCARCGSAMVIPEKKGRGRPAKYCFSCRRDNQRKSLEKLKNQIVDRCEAEFHSKPDNGRGALCALSPSGVEKGFLSCLQMKRRGLCPKNAQNKEGGV